MNLAASVNCPTLSELYTPMNNEVQGFDTSGFNIQFYTEQERLLKLRLDITDYFVFNYLTR